jgi:hypothetical protein
VGIEEEDIEMNRHIDKQTHRHTITRTQRLSYLQATLSV